MSHAPFFLALLHTGGSLDLADVGRDWIGFLGVFCTIGAVSFRTLVLGRAARLRGAPDSDPRLPMFRRATATAATAGLAGALLLAVAFVSSVMESAEEGGGDADAQRWTMLLLGAALLLALLGFVVARMTARRGGVIGWYVAGAGMLYFTLSEAFVALSRGRWFGVVNPLHIFTASLWLGTLFVLVAAGLSAVLHRDTDQTHRGPVVADLVNSFSPVALWSAVLLGTTGVVTAWRHLKYLSALWTTSYGVALMVKLCLVAIIAALGWWNWRRMRPMLGDEPAARAIRRSAGTELAFAALVLVVTAVLINLPTPKAPMP